MTTLAEVSAELAAHADPALRAVNARHGDEHAVKLATVRAIAKRLRTRHDLALELWATGDADARLLASAICRPKAFDRDEIDTMLREARTPKVRDWFLTLVVRKSPHRDELRVAWTADDDPIVASAGWASTAHRVATSPDGLDLDALLDVIESTMADAPDPLQWEMNRCLAQIGIEDEARRPRALAIGRSLGVLEDYPTSPGCTSPYAPVWIEEMVRRRTGHGDAG